MAISKPQIKKKLKENGYMPYDYDTKSLYVALDYKNRIEEFQKLEGLFLTDGAKYITNKRTLTSDGHVQIGNVILGVTPLTIKQIDQRRIQRYLGRESRNSIKNEIYLEKSISQIIWDTLSTVTIIFKERGKRIILKQVRGTKHVGSNVAGRKKADILIVVKQYKIPVSIKMQTASFWESADTYWGKNARKMLERAAIEKKLDANMNGNTMRMKKPVGTTATRQEEKDVVFGSDIVRSGFIVKQTFKAKDFNYDGKHTTLTIMCDRLYQKQSDLKSNDKAWFVLRNNKNIKSKNIGINGIVVDAVPKKSVTGTTQKIERQRIQ